MNRPSKQLDSHTWRFFVVLVPLLMLPMVFKDIFFPTNENVYSDPVQQEIRRQLEGKNDKLLEYGLEQRRLWIFYHGRSFKAVWSEGGKLLPHAGQLRKALNEAWIEGLHPQDYHLEAISTLWEGHTPAALTMLDLLLTDAFMAYAEDLHRGAFKPVSVDAQWYISRKPFYPDRVLAQALSSGEVSRALVQLRPRHEPYRRLSEALMFYRQQQQAEGEWPAIATGPLLRKGSRDPRVISLRERLRREGYDTVPQTRHNNLYDARLAYAVEQYQRRHGLHVDGMIGKQTLASLNVSLAGRIRQLVVNMERWRWMPAELGERYILVNIGGFQLQLVNGKGTELSMKVITGKMLRKTPTFLSQLTHLIFNPSWNVPDSIAAEDLLPQLQHDPQAVVQRGFRFYPSWREDAEAIDPFQVNWKEINSGDFPYKVRQAPGPENLLGQIKFMLPNDFEIYLHDTPDRHLFEQPVRTFSSGCIRLEQPLALAQLITGQPEERIQAWMAQGETRALGLKEPIPVYLGYWTAWVDEQGWVQFRDDIYGRNRLMMEAEGHYQG